MTQIIAAITQEYALLVSDRRLTYGSGPRKGQVYDDNTCKLVNVCGTTGIAYSGVGEMIGRVPTHEWIAKTLAEAGCREAKCAEETLVSRAPSALPQFPSQFRGLTFLFAGWAHFGDPPALHSYWAAASNQMDAALQRTPAPLSSFNSLRRYLRGEETLNCIVIGEPLTNANFADLRRNLQRLADRQIGPREALRLLVEEIVSTSQRCDRVGSNVLGFCIPKRGAQRFFQTGQLLALATQPNADTAAFTYFEEGYNELRQYGPTTICGEWAATDLETENDPSRGFQSSQVRILSVPKPKKPPDT